MSWRVLTEVGGRFVVDRDLLGAAQGSRLPPPV